MSTIAPTQPLSPASFAEAPTPASTASEFYRFTVDQYERMAEVGILTTDDRVELINGYVVTKMPKGPEHVWASMQAGNRLESLLGGTFTLRREAPVRIPALHEPEPDVVIARGNDILYLRRHPEPAEIALVAEVSDTTDHRDRYEKYPAFAARGIPVYWIVNLPGRRIEVYTDPGPGGYANRKDYHSGEAVPVAVDGQRLGLVAVDNILPPEPAAATAEDNGA